eukprot:CAMPEP_0173321266 /NCGR_PEP_ID=MMETSP1143-20121109/29312_1 /TAXON_ID=483371 /ORGANISM="non described non described, Strain CCMP2298" /LENGTH=117 /DNA_ID=CAMNT_0014264993 /DNA_START=84 /DNA_END=437 /DNA_ORIENTATION=+
MDSATPMPEGMAMASPMARPSSKPRLRISFVGHWPPVPASIVANPMANPTMQHIKSDSSSETAPSLTKLHLLTIVPKVQAMTGPMMGDTSMLATMATELFVAKPMPAMTDAMMSSVM